MHPLMKGTQGCSNEEPFNSHKVNEFFSSLNQHCDNHLCLSIFKNFSQVRVVAHGPLVHLHMTQGNKVTSSEHELK